MCTYCCFSPHKTEHFSKKKTKNIMNEALNIRISATRDVKILFRREREPFSSHVHLVSVKDIPTAFLFALSCTLASQIQRNDTNEDEDDFDDDENNKDEEDTKNNNNKNNKNEQFEDKKK